MHNAIQNKLMSVPPPSHKIFQMIINWLIKVDDGE